MSEPAGGDRTSGRLGHRLAWLRAHPKWVALSVVAAAFVAFYLAPLESGLMTAFKTQSGFVGSSPFAPPTLESVTLEPWQAAWAELDFAVVNSLLFVVPAAVLSATFGSLAAYGLTLIDWRGQLVIVVALLAGVFIPYQSVLVPLTEFWSFVGLRSLLPPPLSGRAELIELTVTHTAYGIPICAILFRGYYQTVNREIIEAARLDGASTWDIYRQVVLPISTPMFAVTLIYQFTQIWNDLLFALVLINNPSNRVVTLALNELQGSMVQQYNLQMAGAFIAALPTLIVYIAFGDYFAKGVVGET
jgi:glucose/mannose transport system permease protein